MKEDQISLVEVINSSGGGIATTLDSHYYKGQGEREGTEREFVVILSIGGTVTRATVTDGDKAPTMLARAGTGGGQRTNSSYEERVWNRSDLMHSSITIGDRVKYSER